MEDSDVTLGENGGRVAHMGYTLPPLRSRAEIDRIGNKIRSGKLSPEELSVFEQWRASHLYLINTFQASLRGKRKISGASIYIAQRLKRRPTIFDKLLREPDMSLSRMHDIAGCRLIFPSIEALDMFRQSLHQTKAKHQRQKDPNKYNYILNPKPSGYRGIHDVYKYNVSSIKGKPYNGLQIELQYRTQVQHAWATAVEVSDLTSSGRVKFNEGSDTIRSQFSLASKILARAYERESTDLSASQISEEIDQFQEHDKRTGLVNKLTLLSTADFSKIAKTYRYFILAYHYAGIRSGRLETFGYPESLGSTIRYSELEKEYEGSADVVLVGAKEMDTVRLAYTNYFTDASQFVSLINKAIEMLRKN